MKRIITIFLICSTLQANQISRTVSTSSDAPSLAPSSPLLLTHDKEMEEVLKTRVQEISFLKQNIDNLPALKASRLKNDTYNQLKFRLAIFRHLKHELKLIQSEKQLPDSLKMSSAAITKHSTEYKQLMSKQYEDLIVYMLSQFLLQDINSYKKYCDYLLGLIQENTNETKDFSKAEQLTTFKKFYLKSQTLKDILKIEIKDENTSAYLLKTKFQDIATEIRNFTELEKHESELIALHEQELVVARLITLQEYLEKKSTNLKDAATCLKNLRDIEASVTQSWPSLNFKV